MKPATVLIHFPQRSEGSSSMSYYCDLLYEGLSKRGYNVRIVSKRDLVAAARPGLWQKLLTRTPAVLSTWPELFLQMLRHPDTWLINISQEYIPPFAAARSINIIHDLIQIDYPRSHAVGFFYRRLLPGLSRNAALNISVSNTTQARLARMRINSRVVYNEFELPSRPEPVPGAASRRYTACWVGTLSKHKNLADFIAACKALPGHRFAAVMPGPDAGRVAQEHDMPSNLEVFNSLNNSDYGALLQASKFLASTSLVEGFGRPPGDGALAGCDMVLSDIPIYRELYQGLANFYAPGDIKALAETLANDPANIYDAAIDRFRGWRERNSLVEVIDQVISRAPPRARKSG